MKSSPATLRKHLEGHKFRQTARHGKYLFLATDTRELELHFGMTGSVRYMEAPRDIEHSPLIIVGNIYSDEILYQSGIHPQPFIKNGNIAKSNKCRFDSWVHRGSGG